MHESIQMRANKGCMRALHQGPCGSSTLKSFRIWQERQRGGDETMYLFFRFYYCVLCAEPTTHGEPFSNGLMGRVASFLFLKYSMHLLSFTYMYAMNNGTRTRNKSHGHVSNRIGYSLLSVPHITQNGFKMLVGA